MKAKLKIKNIQSFTDIITNSSSELFCKIKTNGEDLQEVLWEILISIFPYPHNDPEINICVEYDSEDEVYIIEGPQRRWDEYKEFYKTGLKAVLDEKLGKNNYEIIFGNEKF